MILLTEQRYDDKPRCPFEVSSMYFVSSSTNGAAFEIENRECERTLDFHVVKAVARGKLVRLRRETWWKHADLGQAEMLRPRSPLLCPTFL